MRQFLVALFVVLAFAVSASASSFTLNPGGPFTTVTTASGQFFSNVQSWDGAGCGVANFAANEAGCSVPGFLTNSPNLSPLSVLGTGTTAFDFTSTGYAFDVSLLQGVSSHVDEFGWFDGTEFHVLFDNKTLGATATFTPNGVFSLGFKDTYTGKLWNSNGNPSDTQSHFAVFQNGTGYLIGAEDLSGPVTNGSTDFDYNDAIVNLQARPVPEPTSMVLLGTGLMLFAGRLRKFGRK